MAASRWLRLRFVRFLFAGGVAFVVDAGVLSVLVYLFDWPATWSRLISFPTAVTANWLIHRKHVFEPTDNPHTEYLRFAAVQALSATINLGIYFVAILNSPLMARWPVLAVIIGSVIAMFLSYFCNSRFVFNQRADNLSPET